jgi:type I restriction enzyme, R subunit
VTPDADAKTRFDLIDAVGVTESLKSVSQPFERERKIGFDKLIDEIAAGRRDGDALATLVGRLAALDRRISQKDREAVATAAGGVDLAGLAAGLLDSVDPNTLTQRAPPGADKAQLAATKEGIKDAAALPIDHPGLRKLLKDVKAAADIRIDTTSIDAVVFSGWDEAKAASTVERFRRFIDENRDELTALQILYGQPYERA